MARPGWIVLGLALAAAGCGPAACEFVTGYPGDDYCIEVGADPFGSDGDLVNLTCTRHDWQRCSDIGYPAPCTRIDGTVVWKRFGASC